MDLLAGVDALALLPEELWTMIMEMTIDSRQGFESCYETCKLWKSILDKKNNTMWKFHLVFPSLFPYLAKDDTCHCRLVSKMWCEGVDRYLEEQQPILQNSIETESRHRRSLQVDLNQTMSRKGMLWTGTIIKLFQRDFVDRLHTQINPFISRSVHLGVVNIRQSTLEFFENFGSHIWYLHLHLRIEHFLLCEPPPGGESPSFTQYFEFVRDILKQVPNLRGLTLQIPAGPLISSPSRPRHGRFDSLASQEKKSNEEMRCFLQLNALPALPQLKSLNVVEVPWSPLRHAFEVTYAPQLTKLWHLTENRFDLPRFPSLSSLILTPCKYLMNHHFENVKLAEVHATVLENQHFDKLFTFFERFKDTLEHVSICWNFVGGSTLFPRDLNLPKLKTLELREISLGESSSFEFIWSLWELKQLRIHFGRSSYREMLERSNPSADSTPTNIINLDKCFDDLELDESDELYTSNILKSNVWPILSKLEMLRIAHSGGSMLEHEERYRVYTRREFLQKLCGRARANVSVPRSPEEIMATVDCGQSNLDKE